MLFCYVLERLRFPAFVAAQFIPQAFRKEKPPGEIFFCQELPGGFFQRRLFPAVGDVAYHKLPGQGSLDYSY